MTDPQHTSTKRLELLWSIRDAIGNPDTSDDEKWDTIIRLLDQNSGLLVMYKADEPYIMDEPHILSQNRRE